MNYIPVDVQTELLELQKTIQENIGTKVQWIDTKTAVLYEKELKEGDVWHNPPLQPHRLICLQGSSSITEVSTADSVEDNYRVAPGDSQKSKEQNG